MEISKEEVELKEGNGRGKIRAMLCSMPHSTYDESAQVIRGRVVLLRSEMERKQILGEAKRLGLHFITRQQGGQLMAWKLAAPLKARKTYLRQAGEKEKD